MQLGMEVGLSPGDFVLDGYPAHSPKRGQSPQFSAHVYCGQMAAWIKMPLGTEVGLGPDDIVLDGDLAPPSQKGGGGPFAIFGPFLLWPNGWIDHDATWYGGRPRSKRHCVTWGPSSPPKKFTSPQFSARVCCGQTAGWTKMPLGMELVLGPGEFVFDGDPALPRKKGTAFPPNFWPMSIVAKRLDGSRCHLVRR